jgi:hypothetical protein
MDFTRDPYFKLAYSKSISAVGEDLDVKMRVHQAIWASQHSLRLGGTFVELGTGKGFIFVSVLSYLSSKYGNNAIPRVYLFDTFLPTRPDPVTGSQSREDFNLKLQSGRAYASSFLDTTRNFENWSSVNLIQGKLPGSILNYLEEIGEISFLHVDLNHYLPEIETLTVLWSQMKESSIIILDDYANRSRERQMQAHNEFFASKGLSILTTASGQGIVLVRH